MANIIRKTFRAKTIDFDKVTGEVNLFIPVSSGERDRDNEVIEPTAIKKSLVQFMKHPVLIASHDYGDLTNQIGEWKKLKITETGAEGKPQYYINAGNEQADWGFYLASRGMAAFSYGFIPKPEGVIDGDGVTSPRRTYKEVELLEISQVIVPSNREAIQSIRSKGVDSVTEKLLDDVEKDLPEGHPELVKEIVTKPEETDEYIRIPVDRGDHEGHRIRTIDISEKEGIKAIYCGTDKVVMTYLFLKSKGWTMEKARAWVKEHEKSFEPHEVSQAEIIDEIDYLKSLIEKEGLSEDGRKSLGDLMRISGYDKPVYIKIDNGDIPITPYNVDPHYYQITNQEIQEAIKRIAKK